MSTIVAYQTITKPILSRLKSLKSITRAKTKNTCEETDCCGNVIVPCTPDITIERECRPCCFYTWKPKLPKLECPPKVKTVEKCQKATKCYAGMVTPKKKTVAQTRKDAEACFKVCGARPVCPDPPQPKKKRPPFKKYCPPQADWDHDGFME